MSSVKAGIQNLPWFECPAYESIRIKHDSVLFNKFGGCRQASRVFKNDPAKVRKFMDQEPCFQLAKVVHECMGYRRSEECEVVSLTLICHCLERIGKVKCMARVFLISEEFLRSRLLLLRMVLVFLPMEPRWLRPGAPLVGPICNL
jgi:hypothetical protein